MPSDTALRPGTGGVHTALNRRRQRELYGLPLGDRVRRLTTALGITQARLARTIGLSPAMLSQLASGRRVKIGDPAVLARLQLLDRRCGAGPPPGRAAVDALLDEVARARFRWTPEGGPGLRQGGAEGGVDPDPVDTDPVDRGPVDGRPGPASPADALRAVAPPARLAAAAATLAGGFPELAEVLRQAAAAPAAGGPRRPHRRPW